MRNRRRIDVPQFGQLLDVVRVVPVAHARKVAVGTGLAVVLCGWLSVHLEQPAPGRPIIPRRRWMLLTWHAAAVAWFDW